MDFPKTGVPARLRNELRVGQYPDFMGKPAQRSYESQKVLGRLYRMVDEYPVPIFNDDEFDINPLYVVEGHERFAQKAVELEKIYQHEIKVLTRKYYADGEAGAWVGLIDAKE